MSVRRDSLRTRHRGHGFGIHVRRLDAGHFRVAHHSSRRGEELRANPEGLKVGRRLLEATACWAVVNLLYRAPNECLCGGSASGRAVERALFANSAVVKFRQVRRVAGLVEKRARRRTSVRARGDGRGEHVQPRGDESVGDDRVTGSPDVWMTGLGRTVRELRRYALIGTCLIASRGGGGEITSRLRCRGRRRAASSRRVFPTTWTSPSITPRARSDRSARVHHGRPPRVRRDRGLEV